MPFLIPAAIAIGSAVATAAFVVSDVLIPVALGAIGVSGAALAGASAFAFAATTTIVETAALAGISALISPHPNVNTGGSPQQFKPDPNASIPVIMGRYGVGGNLVYQTTSGGSNKAAAGARGNEYLTSFVILGGLGPYQAFETLRFNDTILTFDPNGQACNGGYIPYDEVQEWNPGYRHQNSDGSYINNNYQDRAWQNFQLGALNAGYFAPPSKLASDNAGLPEWTNAHGFSGFCAASLTLVYDQRYYAGGVPQFQWVVQGQKVYDPRQDSTYPGGNGPQRWAGEGATAAQITAARATWTFNQNPAIHALNYALGYFLPDAQTGPGRLYAGIGAGTAGVDMAAFVAAANVADANGWLICGQWTTGDGKWSVITEMLKAGSATPVVDCGIISCIVDQPLTSLGTVTADDLSGDITLPTGSSFTARVNTIFPRYTSEAHRWQMVQADTPVKAATYVTEDGAVRSKTLDWQYVPAVNQACQLAAYTITNGREIPGITLPGKPKLRNYRVGDCFTLDIDEAGLATTKVMVTKRVTDQATGGVTLTVRTETDAKHAYSLGVSGVAPATPGISGVDPTIVEAPLPAFWSTGALEVTDSSTGESRVVIRVTGSADDAGGYAQTVVLRWRPVALVSGNYVATGDQSWSYRSFPASQGQFDLDLNPGVYDVQIAYITVNGAYPDADQDFLDLGIETVGGSTSASTASVPGTAAIPGDRTLSDALNDLSNAQADVGTLQGDVANLQGGLADALDTATSAQSIAANTGSLNANPYFALYTNPTGCPDGWFDYRDSGETIRVAGTLSPFAAKMPAGAGEQYMGMQSGAISAGPGGWYVIEAIATLNSGALTGAGAFLQQIIGGTTGQASASSVSGSAGLSFAADPDITGAVIGAGSVGATYRWSKLVQLTAPNGGDHVNIVAAAHHAGIGDTSQANSITLQEVSFRAASSAEIQAQASATNIGTLQAAVGDLQEAQTSAEASFASDVLNVTAVAGQNGAQDQTIEEAFASLDGKTIAFLQQLVAASGSAPAKFQMVSGDGTSLIGLVAQVLSLANTNAAGSVIDVLTIVGGFAYFASKIFVGSTVYIDPSIPGLVINTGSAAVVLGSGFGANSDLVFWCGPAMGPSSMTKANAKMYFDVSGDAYFGGSLSAGTLKTDGATSDTSTTATATTPVFGSNGGKITVTLSYTYSDNETAQYAAGQQQQYSAAKQNIPNVVANGGGDPGFTAAGQDPGGYSVTLYRSLNGGAFTAVATLQGQGSWNVNGDPPTSSDPGYITYADTAGASLTYTDPQQVAQNRQYQAVLTARNPKYSGGISQNISIICVEE